MAKPASRGSSRSTITANAKSRQERSTRFSKKPESASEQGRGPRGLQFAIEIEETDDPRFYGVTVPDIVGCTTTGRSIDDAIRNAKKAIDLHLRFLREDGLPVPRPQRAVDIRIVAKRVEVAA